MKRLLRKFVLWILKDKNDISNYSTYYPVNQFGELAALGHIQYNTNLSNEMRLYFLEANLKNIESINRKTDLRIKAIVKYIDNKLK